MPPAIVPHSGIQEIVQRVGEAVKGGERSTRGWVIGTLVLSNCLLEAEKRQVAEWPVAPLNPGSFLCLPGWPGL